MLLHKSLDEYLRGGIPQEILKSMNISRIREMDATIYAIVHFFGFKYQEIVNKGLATSLQSIKNAMFRVYEFLRIYAEETELDNEIIMEIRSHYRKDGVNFLKWIVQDEKKCYGITEEEKQIIQQLIDEIIAYRDKVKNRQIEVNIINKIDFVCKKCVCKKCKKCEENKKAWIIVNALQAVRKYIEKGK